MITFARVNEKGDRTSVVVGDKMFIIITHNDTGVSIDYYNFVDEKPFKSEQILFDDLKSK